MTIHQNHENNTNSSRADLNVSTHVLTFAFNSLWPSFGIALDLQHILVTLVSFIVGILVACFNLLSSKIFQVFRLMENALQKMNPHLPLF